MKQKFSKHWKASKQPRKQRKYRANAMLHIRRKFMSANLDKDLRKKYLRRNFALKKGDSVKIMRGEFKKKTGKISLVNLKKSRVAVEGIQKTKKDGSKINVWFAPSNLQIKELDLEDKKRVEAIKRKSEKPIASKEQNEKKQSLSSKEQKDIDKKKNKEVKK